MTILVPSPDNSRHFATLVEILQPQISDIILWTRESCLHSVFTATYLSVIFWVLESSICFIGGELDRNVIALEWSLNFVSSIIYQQGTVTNKIQSESEFVHKLVP